MKILGYENELISIEWIYLWNDVVCLISILHSIIIDKPKYQFYQLNVFVKAVVGKKPESLLHNVSNTTLAISLSLY